MNALTVLLVEHRPMLQEKLTATFVAKVLINQNRARPLVWIASLESTNRTLKNLTALNVKSDERRPLLPKETVVEFVPKVHINQTTVRRPA